MARSRRARWRGDPPGFSPRMCARKRSKKSPSTDLDHAIQHTLAEGRDPAANVGAVFVAQLRDTGSLSSSVMTASPCPQPSLLSPRAAILSRSGSLRSKMRTLAS